MKTLNETFLWTRTSVARGLETANILVMRMDPALATVEWPATDNVICESNIAEEVAEVLRETPRKGGWAPEGYVYFSMPSLAQEVLSRLRAIPD